MPSRHPPVMEPLITPEPGPLGGEKWQHPAYGSITVSRISGRANLFRSDFAHNQYIQLSLYPAELNRSLSRDWVFPRRTTPILEISMSEAQWAAFVSSHNVGEGTPCTIESVEGVERPRLPPPKSRSDQFRAEADATFQAALDSLNGLTDMIQRLGLTAKKTELLLAEANKDRRSLSDSLPFIAQQFEQHVETTVEAARVEVNAYATQLLVRAGLDAIGAEPPIESIEVKS